MQNLYKTFFSCAFTNSLLVRNMKLSKRYRKCLEDIEEYPHGYTVINNSPKLESDALRVSTNIFAENSSISKFPLFYPAWLNYLSANYMTQMINEKIYICIRHKIDFAKYTADYLKGSSFLRRRVVLFDRRLILRAIVASGPSPRLRRLRGTLKKD